MTGGPLGEWSWDAAHEKLTLSLKSGEGIGELNGAWGLSDISKVLDGLSAARLKRAFEGALDTVSCEIVLANGRS